MKINKILLASLFCSFLLLPVWAFGFLNLDTANQYSGVLAMLFTFGIGRMMVKDAKNSNLQYILLLLCPVFYICVGIYAQGLALLSLPMFWAFILYLGALFLPKTKFPMLVYGAVVAYTFLCFFWIYPQTASGMQRLGLENESETIPEIMTEVNLSTFKFLSARDTVTFANKAVLIETWNETCQPCMASIRDLQEEFGKDTSFQQLYLYQFRGKSKLTNSQIFDFQAIKDKNKIYIDVQNRLFQEMKLESYPFFLVFDRKGKLVGYQSGYHSRKKEEILQKLRELLAKAAR